MKGKTRKTRPVKLAPISGKRSKPAPDENWEEMRRRIRQELVDEGLRQFQKKGFDNVTVAEIVESVGISRSSFFRYFRSKDDLAFSWIADSGELLRPIFKAKLQKMELLDALKETFLVAARHHDQDADRISQLAWLAFNTPSLRGRHQGEFVHWENEFAALAQEVRNVPEAERYRVRVECALAITAWGCALQEWARHRHIHPLQSYALTAFSILGLRAVERDNSDGFRAARARR